MKKMLLMVFVAFSLTGLNAQTIRHEIDADRRRAGNSLMAYPEPKSTLTASPAGYKVFYISHYGQNGSRYHLRPDSYTYPQKILEDAHKAGVLTPVGIGVLRDVELLYEDARDRWGELTPLGVLQQRQIARRMVERFPELFEKRENVDARSTTVGRCILSMESMMYELAAIRPQVDLHHNATHRDMFFLNQLDKKLLAQAKAGSVPQQLQAVKDRWLDHRRMMQLLFSDTAYVNRHIDADNLVSHLFSLAVQVQNTELRGQIDLLRIFTADELYGLWHVDNAKRYTEQGACTLNGGNQPYSQRNLLRRIISDADSCLNMAEPCIQLRFGYSSCMLPLICLLDVNGYGLATADLESLDRRGWAVYRMIPMSSNLQLVFYRRSQDDKDVLFKVLLNEQEATLPLPSRRAPYYRWSDFRRYYLRKLDAYREGEDGQ